MKIRSQYPIVTLNTIADKIDYGLTASATETGNGPKFLRITDIQDDKVNWSTVPLCNANETDQDKYSLAAGDIVFARTGATTGKSYLIRKCPTKTVFASYLIRVRPGKSVDPRYISRFFQTPEYWNQINLSTSGTAQGGVNSTKLKTLKIPLPPLEEQKRIADILDKADGIRRKQQEAIRLTEELLRSTFLEMFGDPENTPYPVKTLAESCELITDGTHKTPTYVNEGVPFLRVTDIQDESINWNKVKYIPMEEHLELIKRCHPIRGDILYSKNGTIGIPKIIDWDVEFNIFVSLALLRPKPHVILGEYLESFLHTPFALRQALSHTKTGTVSNLHLVEIRKVKLPVPAIEVQEKWLFQRSQIQKQQKKQLQTFIKTDNLFKSLLQRAFKGEL